jgi:hypothetical protein
MSAAANGRAMRTPSRSNARWGAVVVVAVCVALLANGATAAGGPGAGVGSAPDGVERGHVDLEPKINGSNPQTHPIPDDAELTVVANQGFFPDDENAEIVAFTRNGTLVYHNDTYGVYFDVDPVPGTKYTVEYLASAQLTDCEQFDSGWCTRNVLERVNLSTGETERLWSETTPRVTATRHHDADRINDTHVALADIHRDSLRVVNVTSGETTWEWSATNIYEHGGDERPQDWTHVNDVEVLADGSFMLSMRNQDEVVFVRPGEGYLPERTLGEDGNHSILYEQHNPDYIPAENGGPAILVGDSENNRVVEYRWVGDGDDRTWDEGRWERTWGWRDARMQWPRDADRLPDGRTLIVDSNGDRLLEVDRDGDVIWSVDVGMPYDAERLGTGDESTGGPALSSDDLIAAGGPVERGLLTVKDVLPSRVVNGALFSASAVGAEWFGFVDLLVLVLLVLTLLAWGGAEYYWASWSVAGAARTAYARTVGDR